MLEIKVTLTADSALLEALSQIVNGFTKPRIEAEQPVQIAAAVTEPKKRTSPVKKEPTEAAPVATAQVEATVTDEGTTAAAAEVETEATTPPPTNNQITVMTLRNLVVQVTQNGRKDEARSVFAKYGVKGVSDLEPAHYEEVNAELKKLL